MSPYATTRRRRPVTRSRRRDRTGRTITFTNQVLTNGTVTVGTSRITDLLANLETRIGSDLVGARILRVTGQGNLQGATQGAQSYTYALQVGSTQLDGADMLPATNPDDPWWLWRVKLHRAQAHDLGIGTEFDEYPLRFATRGPRVLRQINHTVWFVEETLGQNQAAFWNFKLTIELP